jgi:hypothetical protein
MIDHKDIYRSAQLLIKQHGQNAEDIAAERMQELMQKDDAKGASVWLEICHAIDVLNMRDHQGKLH